MLAGHGIICWAETAKECYEQTIRLIAEAAQYLNAKLAGKPAFGGAVAPPCQDRAVIASALMPRLRALMTGLHALAQLPSPAAARTNGSATTPRVSRPRPRARLRR